MEFKKLFEEIQCSEKKDLEYCSLLGNVREAYENFLNERVRNPIKVDAIDRSLNMTFTVDPNDFMGMINTERDTFNFDYTSEFNPIQKSAINLLLAAISASQEGVYFKSLFALYIWKKLLPAVTFYSVGLSDLFYSIAETKNVAGEYVFKAASEINHLIELEQQKEFFVEDEERYCEASKRLIREIDIALEFILDKYAM